MTLSELKKKDVICIGDGRLLGRVCDVEFDAKDGRIRTFLLPQGSAMGRLLHGGQECLTFSWNQISCIGDDVILVCQSCQHCD